MSEATRWMVALAFISLPTIAFGGSFLLTILKRQVGTENITSVQREYFKAGHAHAGVLATIAIVGQLVLDYSRFQDWAVWLLRIGLFISPILISAGFFGGAPRTADAKPGSLVKLISVGAMIFGVSTLGLGVSLLVSM
jgi:ABC-type multidrug transport system permease subunit